MSLWGDELKKLSGSFPLQGPGDAQPELLLPIDAGVKDMLLAAMADLDSAANPFYVEELLQDCVNRISNCLVLREKAQDIEERAVFAAESYIMQKVTIDTQATTATLLDKVNKDLSLNATSATYQAGIISFKNDIEWEPIVLHRHELEKALTERNERLKTKSSTPGNAANYAERFSFLKKLFDRSLRESFRRAHVASKALKEIYSIDLPVPDVIPIGFLNNLSIWVQAASDALDREIDNRYLGRIAFTFSSSDETLPANTLYEKSKFSAKVTSGAFDFTLTSDPFEKAGMKDVRLRSIKVLADGKDQTRTRLWSVNLKLPESALTKRGDRFSTIATSSFSDVADPEAIVKGVHNIDPRGSWELKIGPRAITGEVTSPAELANIYILLTVSYRRL